MIMTIYVFLSAQTSAYNSTTVAFTVWRLLPELDGFINFKNIHYTFECKRLIQFYKD